jgi:Transposase DDE domain group 1
LGIESRPERKPPIAMHATSFLPGLSPVAGKSLTTARDAGNLSSKGGAVVLREAAHRLGFAQAIAGPLPDTRNPLFVTHTYADMVMARMVAIACGYEDHLLVVGPGACCIFELVEAAHARQARLPAPAALLGHPIRYIYATTHSIYYILTGHWIIKPTFHPTK